MWQNSVALLPALASGVLSLWGLEQLQAPVWPAAAVLLAHGAVAWRKRSRAAVGLAWDGQHWSADGRIGPIAVMVDLGGWLLLRLRPEPVGPAIWVAVSAGEGAGAWHALRAALHAGGPRQPKARQLLPPS